MNKELSETILSTKYVQVQNDKFISDLGLDAEIYELIVAPPEAIKKGVSGVPYIKTKSTNDEELWMCKNCRTYHVLLEEERVDLIYRHRTYGVVDSMCKKTFEPQHIAGGCVVCGEQANVSFTFSVNMVCLNSFRYSLHCSEECMKSLRKRNKKYNPNFSLICAFCGDVEKKKTALWQM